VVETDIKEPYFVAKEPCTIEKEPYIIAKELIESVPSREVIDGMMTHSYV